MPALPSGTVTFLFSDIEGSTRLLQQVGEDRFATLLGEHQAILRAAWQAHGGHEIVTEGDSFFVAFPSATEAVAAAVAATRALAAYPWPEGSAVRVRIGLHTGTPQLVGEQYIGLDVHRAARIAAAGHGGQILLSESTRALVENALPTGTSLQGRGEHRLKDLQRPEHLFLVSLAEFPPDERPLRTLDRARHNLPVQLTPLVGREQAVRAVVALLLGEGVRLETLVGPGGIGKTRLALQVAAELADRFADGVFLVSLGAIRDPALVPPTIAQTLGVREAGTQSAEESLRGYLEEREVLLVLDNFEQVVGAAPLLTTLLSRCPQVKLLVTSRIALHVRGEHEYVVAPLALPGRRSGRSTARGAREPMDARALSQYAAVALFLACARAARSDFQLTAANAPAVAEICARLDGLPLAIELAAARVKLLAPPALLARLSSRLKLLTGGPRDLPERQQTLHNAIAWSYDLLSPEEQMLFRRLAIFAGGWTLEAAEAICAAPGEGVDPLNLDLFEGLASLMDKSLVRQDEGAEETDEPRFRMLETIREFGLEQLDASGERAALTQAHARYYLDLAERADPNLHEDEQLAWEERLEREHDNLRAVLAWAQSQPSPTPEALEWGVRLAAALHWFWTDHGFLSEGHAHLEHLLALCPDPDRTDRDLVPGQVRALYALLYMSFRQNEAAITHDQLEEVLVLARRVGDARTELDTLSLSGIKAITRADWPNARVYLEQSLALGRARDDGWAVSRALNNLGEVAYYQGDWDRAQAWYEEGLMLSRARNDMRSAGVEVSNLARVALRKGDVERALALSRESLASEWQTELVSGFNVCWEMIVCAYAAASSGKERLAALVLGTAQVLRETMGAVLSAQEREDMEYWLAPARAALGEAAWAAAVEEGRALSLEEAVAIALGTRDAEPNGSLQPTNTSASA